MRPTQCVLTRPRRQKRAHETTPNLRERLARGSHSQPAREPCVQWPVRCVNSSPRRMPAPKSSDVIAAATECDAKKLKTLIDAKADPNAVGHSGNSALHCAALKGDTAAALATVKLLLEAGADCTSENDGGENPLALAQKKKHTKVVTALEEATEKAAAAEAERKKAKAAAKAAAKAKASGGGGGGGSSSGSGGADGAPGEPLPYRRTASVGWKPLLKDWNKCVMVARPLISRLRPRLSFTAPSGQVRDQMEVADGRLGRQEDRALVFEQDGGRELREGTRR